MLYRHPMMFVASEWVILLKSNRNLVMVFCRVMIQQLCLVHSTVYGIVEVLSK